MASSSARRSSFCDERHKHKSVLTDVGSIGRARFRIILRTLFFGPAFGRALSIRGGRGGERAAAILTGDLRQPDIRCEIGMVSRFPSRWLQATTRLNLESSTLILPNSVIGLPALPTFGVRRIDGEGKNAVRREVHCRCVIAGYFASPATDEYRQDYQA